MNNVFLVVSEFATVVWFAWTKAKNLTHLNLFSTVREFWKNNCLVTKRRKFFLFVPIMVHHLLFLGGVFLHKLYVCVIHLFLKYLLNTFSKLGTFEKCLFFPALLTKLYIFNMYSVMIWHWQFYCKQYR